MFVGLLAMSAVQFFLLEVDDLTSISVVEEQQETISSSVEVQGLDFDSPQFQLFTREMGTALREKYRVIHLNKNYHSISLAGPYSPPELS
jgi:hypothetical protein